MCLLSVQLVPNSRMSFCGSVFHYYPASLRWGSIQILFFPPWVNSTVGLFDVGNVLLCPMWFVFFSNGAVLSTNNAQFLFLALQMKQHFKRAWDSSHMMLLFSYGAGVTQPKESDLGGESLAEREQIKLHRALSPGLRARMFLSWWCGNLPSVNYWGWAFSKDWFLKICGVAAIFGHGQNVYTCYTDALAKPRENQKLGISTFL